METYIHQGAQDLFWIRTDTGIRFVHTLPVNSNTKQAIALSDIPQASLNRLLQAHSHNSVYILNRDGELLYSSNTEQDRLTQEAIEKIKAHADTKDQTGQLQMKLANGENVRWLYAASSYNNWLYVTELEAGEVSQALSTTRFGLIAMGGVLLVLVVAASYYLSVYLARPIRQIQRSLPHNADSDDSPRDEVDWILRSIDTIVTEKKSLEQLMEMERPKLETQFVLNLLHGRLPRNEVEQSIQRFGYGSESKPRYMTMLIQIDSYDGQRVSNQDVLLLAVNNLVREVVPAEKRMRPVVLNEKTQATLLRFGEQDSELRKLVQQYGRKLITTAREYLKCSISIGLSTPYADIMESKRASETSLESLHQRLNLGKESIIFFDDISSMLAAPSQLRYPAELEGKLFDAIRLGDEEAVLHSLYPLLAEMMKISIKPADLEVILIRFVNNLIQLEQLIGSEVLLTQHNNRLYHRLLDTRNPEEIERILIEEVIQPLVRSVKEKTDLQYRSIAEQIVFMIHKEYDSDLSLESISDRLHYSPNYLSSVFKREFGTTFSDYLIHYRLKIATEWLETTDMTIKEIAERLRYQNPQNFIRTFRKREQMTPGAYRKMKQEK